MHEERKIERHANGEPYPEEANGSAPPAKAPRKSRKASPKAPEEKREPLRQATPDPEPKASSPARTEEQRAEGLKTDQHQPGIDFASVNTVENMAQSLAKKAEPTPPKWSGEDDQNLSRGFQKYGFHWTAISKDPELNLQDRSGPQLRDRFRVKFPIHYQSSVPIELPEQASGYDRDQRPRRRAAPKGGTKVSLDSSTNLRWPKNNADGTQATASGQRSKNMSIADIIKPTDSARTPRITRTSLPSMQSLCAKVDAQPLPEPTGHGGTFFDVQPLPEEGEDFDESEFDDMMSEDNDGDEQEGYVTGDEQDDNDRRHLGISGLLNEPEAETTSKTKRLPPFKSTYDDVQENWGQNAVTLPPLLLEAQRPMSELD